VLICVSKYVLSVVESLSSTEQGLLPALQKNVTAIDTYSDDVCKILKMDTVLAEIDILVHEIAKTPVYRRPA